MVPSLIESLLITLREGFEAALIVAIVLAYLRRTDQGRAVRAVWAGVAAATVVSIGAGLGLRLLFDGLEGAARLRAFAITAFVAAGVLTWMIFWMRKQARNIKGELEGKLSEAVSTGSLMATGAVAFFAVVREGLETALFLLAASTGARPLAVVTGGLVGLALAIGVALLIYKGGQRIPIGTFFLVTGSLLILFAAGLLARGVMLLQAAGSMGSLDMAVYDVTSIHWLTIQTQVGRFLAGIFGWDPRPSLEQVVAYVGYLIPVAILFVRGSRPPRVAPARSRVPAAARSRPVQ